jgi:DNA-binding response OmpR family regulator
MTVSKKIDDLLSTTRILVVGDDNLLRSVLIEQLGFEGVKYLAEAATAADIFIQIDTLMPELILLDVQLPDGNGFEICARLRQSSFDKPILMLTGQDNESDIIKGLEVGANDCIAKPMRIGEVLGRIKEQLRLYRSSGEVRLMIGDSDFLPADKTVTDNLSGKIITLTEKETLILKKLFRDWPADVSKDNLLLEVWGMQPDISTHTLETHIYRLRQKLTRISSQQIINTTEQGYQLNKIFADQE